MSLTIDLTPMPVETVVRVDRDAVLRMLESGPVNFGCTFEQAKVLQVYVVARLGRGFSMKAIRIGDEVVGYRLSFKEAIKRRREVK